MNMNPSFNPQVQLQGSTNCVHGEERACNMHAEVFTCTKLLVCKSIKALLSSAQKLFKIASCFCVSEYKYSAQQDLAFIISFSLDIVIKYSNI